MNDCEIVGRQIGRTPRAFRAVAVRCPYGRPAVTEQAPFDENGKPFPTQYWITCSHLAAAIARIEADGGVERWTRAAHDDPELARSLDDANAKQRELRPELPSGIGGSLSSVSQTGGSLKCLHAHAAFALAQPGYKLGDRILAELPSLWPTSCCTDL